MEFYTRLIGVKPDLGAIEQALRAVDPAGVVDIEDIGRLRVAAAVTADERVTLVWQAGVDVIPAQVIQVPSTCCGGCSG